MARFGIAPGPSGTRRRIATAFAAAGALLLSSGLVIAAAAPASADHRTSHNPGGGQGGNNGNAGGNGNGNNPGGGGGSTPGGGGAGGNGNGGGSGNVGGGRLVYDATSLFICHRTGGDRNPYTMQRVADSSGQDPNAHYDHLYEDSDGNAGEDKYWKGTGEWLSPGGDLIEFQAGIFKPDYFFVPPSGADADAIQTALDIFAARCNAPADLDDDDSRDDTLTLALPLVSLNENCGVAGSVSEPTTAGIEYTIGGEENWTSITEGGHTVTAQVTEPRTTLEDPSGEWTIHRNGRSATLLVDLGDYTQCAGLATVTADSIKKCDTWGSVSRPANTATVSYTISGDQWNDIEGSKTVRATVIGAGYTLPASVTGWTVSADRLSATRTFQLGSFEKCSVKGDDDDDDPKDKLVSPRYPSTTDATCTRDGRLAVPNQPQGVRVERTGSVPGTVTFTFSPASGYAFPAGTDRQVSLVVEEQLGGVDCIQGVETVRPNPQPGSGPGTAPVNGGTDAEVLGEQAVAVPTAVAAGLGGTTSVTSTTGSPQLASALVAGGLLMLVAGGATGLGRRTRGAHES